MDMNRQRHSIRSMDSSIRAKKPWSWSFSWFRWLTSEWCLTDVHFCSVILNYVVLYQYTNNSWNTTGTRIAADLNSKQGQGTYNTPPFVFFFFWKTVRGLIVVLKEDMGSFLCSKVNIETVQLKRYVWPTNLEKQLCYRSNDQWMT
jgi:hypothetical protein